MKNSTSVRRFWLKGIVLGALALGLGAVGVRANHSSSPRGDIETGAWGGVATNGLRPASVVRGDLSRTRPRDIETGAWGGTATNGLVPAAVVRGAFSTAPAAR